MRRQKCRAIGWCWAESVRHTILVPGCLRRGPSTEQPTAEGLIPKPFLELELGWLEGFSESIRTSYPVMYTPRHHVPSTHQVLAPCPAPPFPSITLSQHLCDGSRRVSSAHHASSTYFNELECCLVSALEVERRSRDSPATARALGVEFLLRLA